MTGLEWILLGSLLMGGYGIYSQNKAAKKQEKAMKEMAAAAQQQAIPQAVDRTAAAQEYGSSTIKRMMSKMFGSGQTVLTGADKKKNRTILGI